MYRIIWPFGEDLRLSEARQLRTGDVDRDHQRAEREDGNTGENLQEEDKTAAP
ncbi:hypothetical protein QP185_08440 [Sphingomonas aerolata]|uniref:hypothetical protein n=1 Tax=Sphingomonas aerolata TaxID=185951 RepID=UPI002FE0A365